MWGRFAIPYTDFGVIGDIKKMDQQYKFSTWYEHALKSALVVLPLALVAVTVAIVVAG